MSRITPPVRDLARRLLAAEAPDAPAGTEVQAANLVCERFRPQLATLMGRAGFSALLSRSLALAKADAPLLGAVQIQTDGTLQGLEQMAAPVDQMAPTEDGVVLISHLISLLVTFIGENLTLRLVREIWPTASPEDLNFNESNHP